MDNTTPLQKKKSNSLIQCEQVFRKSKHPTFTKQTQFYNCIIKIKNVQATEENNRAVIQDSNFIQC